MDLQILRRCLSILKAVFFNKRPLTALNTTYYVPTFRLSYNPLMQARVKDTLIMERWAINSLLLRAKYRIIQRITSACPVSDPF